MKILITAAGGGGTNGILKTFSNSDIEFIGINSNFHVAAASSLKYNYLVPRASEEQAYLDAINSIIEKHNVEFIIPNSDLEAEILAKHIDQLKCRVFVNSLREMEISNDKFLTYNFCIENKIDVPLTYELESFADIDNIVEKHGEFPLWIRTRFGAGSKNTKKVHSVEEAKKFITDITENKSVAIEDVTISEFLSGADCLVTSLWIEGELKFMAMAHRQAYRGEPGSSPPIRIKKFYSEKLEKYCRDIALKLNSKPHGIYNCDIKHDSKGNPKITEFNLGRFYYNMPLFNNSVDNMFKFYIDNVVLGKNESTVISKDELFFLRDQDNFPVVLTEDEMNAKVNLDYSKL